MRDLKDYEIAALAQGIAFDFETEPPTVIKQWLYQKINVLEDCFGKAEVQKQVNSFYDAYKKHNRCNFKADMQNAINSWLIRNAFLAAKLYAMRAKDGAPILFEEAIFEEQEEPRAKKPRTTSTANLMQQLIKDGDLKKLEKVKNKLSDAQYQYVKNAIQEAKND